MRILMMSKYFPPEIGTAAHLFHEMAVELVKRGHEVTVATTFPWYNLAEIPERYKGRRFMREEMDGVKVVRMAGDLFPEGKLKLVSGHLTVPPAITLAGLRAGRHDLVYAYSPPLFMGLGALLARWWGVPFVFGVQDLFPQSYIDVGMMKDPFSIAFFKAMEWAAYRLSTHITVHSEGNKDYIVGRRGIAPEKITVIPNWVDTNQIGPGERRNDFSRTHGLDDRFVVSYAGTFGVSQGSMVVVEAARLLKDHPDIHFLFVGGGVDKPLMEAKIAEYGLRNCTMLPMQPKEVYPSILHASDISLTTLKADVKTPVVPSKILSIMAAERPVVASLPLDGDAKRLVDEARCGYCVPPEDPAALVEALLKLRQDPEACREMGRRGRAHVVEHGSPEGCVKKLESLFESLVAARQGTPRQETRS